MDVRMTGDMKIYSRGMIQVKLIMVNGWLQKVEGDSCMNIHVCILQRAQIIRNREKACLLEYSFKINIGQTII